MLRLKEPAQNQDWQSIYDPHGQGGWNQKGLCLVDWGSAIDLLSFPEEFKFQIDRHGIEPDPSMECWELRNNKPWTYELDWYAVAGVVHILLFGTYMQVQEESVEASQIPHMSLSSHFKRYWQVEMWRELFEILLNSGSLNNQLLETTVEDPTMTVGDQSLLGPGTDFEVLQQDFPAVKLIHEKRLEMESWLKSN